MNAKAIILAASGLGAAALGVAALSQGSDLLKEPDKPAPTRDASAEKAMKALRAERRIKDLVYQPDQIVQWQVGVINDGTSRVGYAN